MNKPFNIHDWHAKQKQQLLTEAEGVDHKERLVQTIVDVFNGRLGNWFPPHEMVRSMSDVQDLFNRDREAITDLVRAHLRDVTVDSGQDTTSGGGVNEHHEEEEFPGKDLSAFELLDKLEKGKPKLYKAVENFMKHMNEMSSTSTVATFNAGNSMAHLGKKKKK